MSEGFDLSKAVKERADSIGPFPLITVDETFYLAPIIEVEWADYMAEGDYAGFISAAMGEEAYQRFTDMGIPMDQEILVELLGAYFEHCGKENPWTNDETEAGESEASTS